MSSLSLPQEAVRCTVPCSKLYKSPTHQNRYSLGLCIYCGECPPRVGRSSCSDCGARQVEHNRKHRERHRDWYNGYMSEYRKVKGFADRMTVLYHYGGNPPQCACCGLTATSGAAAIAFFAIDHIDGYDVNSGQPRASGELVHWILKNDFPPGFQVLCHNCNMARSILGRCPHEIDWDIGPPGVFLDGGGI